jgi:hypothetical protein
VDVNSPFITFGRGRKTSPATTLNPATTTEIAGGYKNVINPLSNPDNLSQ